ncbi:MAG: 30S ribosomal protein S19e [Candidatus Aenigmarchaeota archaeon]|nr:30S ribosomal protein S19e [Candidatus Aenigmarchaeota archaeon]MCX8179353.1 30S ribosomal protein S19e [Candidatus Aenigmarchaeota archaeon]
MRKLIMQVKSQDFVKKCSEELKKIKEIKMPEWAKYAKTGSHRKYPPHQEDWWYIRAASLLRRIALDGPVGVSRLRTFYGGRKERGHKPEKFRKAGGNAIRKILQQLQMAGLVEQSKQGRKGRVLTEKGKRFIAKMIEEIKNV